MPLRICESAGCQQPAERNKGNCMICGKHLCLDHASFAVHTCPREQDDADMYFEAYDAARTKHQDTLIARIKLTALQSLASSLRNGIACAIPALTDGIVNSEMLTSQMGGQNLHADIVFEDGITWIARIRLDNPFGAPVTTRDAIAESEVATLKFLSGTKLPTPAVHHYTLSSCLDDVGVPYMLMDKLKGSPLDWQSLDAPKKSKVLLQLADIFIEISRYPFDQGGSLMLGEAQQPAIAGFAQKELFCNPKVALGPFAATNNAAKTVLDFYMGMYASGELADFPVDSYLAFAYRKTLVDNLYPPSKQQSFFLKHFEDKGDHILVDEEANITGIIDWEYASAECEELAFSTPCMMWPVLDYFDGNNELSVEEREFHDILQHKGHKQLAETVLYGRLHQRFWFFLGGGAAYDRNEFVNLLDGLRKAYAERGYDDNDILPYEDWRKVALGRLTMSDPRLQQLLRRERARERSNE